MKKVILLMLLFVSIFGYSKAKVSTKPNIIQISIVKDVDQVTNQIRYHANRDFIFLNKIVSFDIFPLIEISRDNLMKVRLFSLSVKGVNKCSDGNDIVIRLENDDIIYTSSFDKFNCNGDHSFKLDSANIERLKKSPISKIRVSDVELRYMEDITISVKNKKYFIELFNAIDKYNLIQK